MPTVAEPVRHPWHDMCREPLLSFRYFIITGCYQRSDASGKVAPHLLLENFRTLKVFKPVLQEVNPVKNGHNRQREILIIRHALIQDAALVFSQWLAHELFITCDLWSVNVSARSKESFFSLARCVPTITEPVRAGWHSIC